MRVLMIGTDRAYFESAPAGDAVARHVEYARKAGSLDIIVVGKGKVTFKGLSPHLRVYLTNTSKIFHLSGVLRIAKKLMSESKYNLIVSQDLSSPAGYILKKKYSLPLIVSVHSMFFNKGLFSFNLINQWGVSRIKKAIKSADGVRVNNTAIKDELVAWGVRAPILVQSTPVDLSSFIVDRKIRNKVPNILFVGRLTSEKNVGLLIRAVKSMPSDFHLTIVGDGTERNKLEELAEGDSRITFVGGQSYAELPNYYNKADIFVLPSDTESFGKVLLEAAASQCAIISTQTAGAQSILTHEKDAILTAVGDKKALQMALESLINDVDLQEALGKQAFETARKYDFEESIERTVQFWRQIAQ